jgi:hypothetical protein
VEPSPSPSPSLAKRGDTCKNPALGLYGGAGEMSVGAGFGVGRSRNWGRLCVAGCCVRWRAGPA